MPELIISKQCSLCKEVKSIMDFYEDKTRSDRYQNRCKICEVARIKLYQQTDRGKEIHQRAVRRYRQTSAGKEVQYRYRQNKVNKEAMRRYTKRYRESQKGKITRYCYRQEHLDHIQAGCVIYAEVCSGRLPRPKSLLCEYCGQSAQIYHHHKGYTSEHHLDVVPVCRRCHWKIHYSKHLSNPESSDVLDDAENLRCRP